MIHKETVNEQTLQLMRKLSSDEKFREFALGEDVSLSLQIGHRRPERIGFYTMGPFDARSAADHLQENYRVNRIIVGKREITGQIDGVNVEVGVPHHPISHPPVEEEGVRMLSLEDIAAEKVKTIYTDEAGVRDYVDTYYLLEHRSMNEIVGAYMKKYPGTAKEDVVRNSMWYSNLKVNKKAMALREGIKWPKVIHRIKEAVLKPDIRYEPSELRLGQRIDWPDGRRSIGR